VNTELEIRNKERRWLLDQSELFSRRVANTPLREQAIEATRREYDSLLEEYERMKRNLSETKLSKNLENQQRGEQFKIIESASLPQIPYKPNRQMALMFTLALSLGCGLGLAFFRDITDQSVHGVSVLNQQFRFPVLAKIQLYVSPGQRTRDRVKKLLRTAGWIIGLGLAGAVCAWLAVRLELADRMTNIFYSF
jgi:hypothetical protein